MPMKLPRGPHLKVLFGALALMWASFLVTAATGGALSVEAVRQASGTAADEMAATLRAGLAEALPVDTAILDGELNPTSAFMTGKLKVDGDMGAAMRLSGILA